MYLKIFINFVALQMEQDPTNLYFSNLPKDFDERVSLATVIADQEPSSAVQYF